MGTWFLINGFVINGFVIKDDCIVTWVPPPPPPPLYLIGGGYPFLLLFVFGEGWHIVY